MMIGSGLSYHNLNVFGPEVAAPSAAFDQWLNEAMQMSPSERTAHLDSPFKRLGKRQNVPSDR